MNLDFFFFEFLATETQNNQKKKKIKNEIDIREQSLHSSENIHFVRHIFFTVSFVPTIFPLSFAVQPHMTIGETRWRPKTTNKIINSQACEGKRFFFFSNKMCLILTSTIRRLFLLLLVFVAR